MRMFTISKFYGMKVYMLSGDEDKSFTKRPYVLVDYGMRSYKAYVDTGEIYPNVVTEGTKILKKWVRARKKELMSVWEKALEDKRLPKISPIL